MLKFPAESMRHTIFIRMVVTYLVIILPILLLGLYLYNWSYKNASQDLSRATLSQLTYYLEALNREIEWMEIQQYDLAQDTELNKIAVTWEFMDDVQKRESLNYITQRVTSLKNSSAYISDVYVHIRTIDKTISAMNAIDDLDSGKYNFFQSVDLKKEGRLINWNNFLELSVAESSGRMGEPPLFIIQIELDNEKLKDSLKQINAYAESGSLLVSMQSGYALGTGSNAQEMLQSYNQAMHEGKLEKTRVLDGMRYHVDSFSSGKLGMAVVTYLPETAVKRPLTKFVLWAWLFAAASFLAVLMYSYATYKLVQKPLLVLVRSFKKMESGSLDIQIVHARKDEFGYLYLRFNQMLSRLRMLIDQDYTQKLMMQRAELKQLQSQINPHFLYNSFFILNSLAKQGDITRIEAFSNMLGEYFRFITRNGEDNVRLAEETRHSQMYTEIQKMRFSRRIHVQFDELPEELENIRVPRLILQPIIENAYEHCLEKQADEGELRVSFEKEETEVRIIVEDNGSGITDDGIETLRKRLDQKNESYEITGMINIHRRIQLIYGEGSGLFVDRSGLNGLKVVIRIRLTGGEELV
ncbi:two-component sensor histidine kinase [Paenibacillus helianthi]|uniref:Two-component sensor histidine kinase n=1 Tax=Paenibacillus helianthi TaxID=1349432 RepID=A0ABX3ESL8_9BACL|nr:MULTISPECIES: histidine kinase [Paenibacillus]OKP89782.1 two-component sensor histidine kinase [Paenibacillus sp. P32E]OKP90934.1 two-component sensor histidine kinase [Paenibacillus helianthi]